MTDLCPFCGNLKVSHELSHSGVGSYSRTSYKCLECGKHWEDNSIENRTLLALINIQSLLKGFPAPQPPPTDAIKGYVGQQQEWSGKRPVGRPRKS